MLAVDDKAKVLALKREKEEMISRYMTLQDNADAMNEELYRVCCGIEILNSRIEVARQEFRRSGKKKAPVNGKHRSSKK